MADRTRGRDGEDGLPGQSAYEVALSNGFVGSESEWLASLKGEPGRDGRDGADGRDGVDGRDGQDGRDGKDADVSALLREVQDQVAIAVERTPRPTDGRDGRDGRDGIDGRDLALVDAVALFDRDEKTKLTQLVTVADLSGAVLCTILPVRDEDDYMTSARIEVAA